MRLFNSPAHEARWNAQVKRLSKTQRQALLAMKFEKPYTPADLKCHYTTMNVLAREGFCVWSNRGEVLNDPRNSRKFVRVR